MEEREEGMQDGEGGREEGVTDAARVGSERREDSGCASCSSSMSLTAMSTVCSATVVEEVNEAKVREDTLSEISPSPPLSSKPRLAFESRLGTGDKG